MVHKINVSSFLAVLALSYLVLIPRVQGAVITDTEAVATAYNEGRFTQAILSYRALTKKGDRDAFLNLGVIFKDLGAYERSVSILKKARSLFGDDKTIPFLLGRVYYLSHNIDAALVIYNKILEKESSDADAYLNLGLCYEEKGDFAKAQAQYERALSLDENSMLARLALANFFYRTGKFPQARNHYKTIHQMDQSLIGIQQILGDVSYRLGNFQESLKYFQKLRAIEPTNVSVQEKIQELTERIGPAYFQKEREKLAQEREKKKVLLKAFPKVKDIVSVKVGIVLGEKKVEFQCSTAFEVTTKSGEVLVALGLPQEKYNISLGKAGYLIVSPKKGKDYLTKEPILIKPKDPAGTLTLLDVKAGKDNFWAGEEDRSYRGFLEVRSTNGGITVINNLNLEEYLYGVLPSEMPPHWPKEALKAQAVAARSEAMAKLGRHAQGGFDFCAEVHCQAYSGVEQENAATSAAVDETQGIVMFSQGKPIDAVYSSNCSGHTQDNIFGDEDTAPYLKGVLDSLENQNLVFPLSPLALEEWLKRPPPWILCDTSGYGQNSQFRWVRMYEAQVMDRMMSKIADVGEVRKIVAVKREKSGHISALKIVGSRSTYTLRKELTIRKALGNLRSSMFKVEMVYGLDKKPQTFLFLGGGWGHGVGMCQAGSRAMALLGKNYSEILRHYFQEVELKKIY